MKRKTTFYRLQNEAANRPGSKCAETPYGRVWMSPIEFELYMAMLDRGLDPIPQYCSKGYFIDFAFVDVKVGVEADGIAYHNETTRKKDRRRRAILIRDGWRMLSFKGTTIHHRASNCAFVVRKEVMGRRMGGGLPEATRVASSGDSYQPVGGSQHVPLVDRAFCAYCGARLAFQAVFCSRCGRHVYR